MIDWTELIQAVIDQLVLIVPALGALALAWIAHRTALIRAVKREAVDAEKALGPGAGTEKHRLVRRKLSGWTARGSTIDELIRSKGQPVAQKYRESIPPETP